MRRQECWNRLAEALDARRQLWCADCGRRDNRRERGWTLHIRADGELDAFCPACDPRAPWYRFGL